MNEMDQLQCYISQNREVLGVAGGVGRFRVMISEDGSWRAGAESGGRRVVTCSESSGEWEEVRNRVCEEYA